ncbi:MAG: metallophosphatase family protein [Deltaproteobacteria bacterium]|nr:metallophosphatase family protein [Deltaproteobacteria bacterium]
MRVAMISDVHSNLEALKAVLEEIEKDDISLVVNLGDLVGYNANPKECVDLVQKRKIISILGNHDRAATELKFAEGFNILAYQALVWSSKTLSKGHKKYLSSLEHTRVLWDRYLLFHGAPENPESYVFYLFQAKKVFNYMRKKTPGVRIGFFGHTHHRAVWKRDIRGKVSKVEIPEEQLVLDAEQMYIINPGSVGQPRQQQWKASYLVFTNEPETISFRSVAYDVQSAQSKIREAHLPDYLAQRLEAGV